MNLLDLTTQEVNKVLSNLGAKGKADLVVPPDLKMGDFSFACFALAKEMDKNPVELAKVLSEKFDTSDLLEKVVATGPYVNFFLNNKKIAEVVLNKNSSKPNKKEKIMVEFAHPNTHKAFHIGHLRNIITGESVVRILENAGFKVVRANYQGDVGMHIAKCLYTILQMKDFDNKVSELKSIEDKVKFLGQAYAAGHKFFAEDKQAKKDVVELNKRLYNKDQSVQKIYQTTRQWSLDYFDKIYKKVGSHFDRFYFESEVYGKGIELVKEFLDKSVFAKGEKGAIIFEGEKHGLHNRVFLNSEGYPTYEAKELALAELQIKEHNPDKIIHVVGKEQTEYFRVVFKALEKTLPISKNKEFHLDYGWVTLKSGKMGARTGQVVLGEWLLLEIEKKVAELMVDNDLESKERVIQKIAIAAVKYSFLKTGVKNDIKFDLDESINMSGDSGPYLLYIVARIKSILNKNEAEGELDKNIKVPTKVAINEKQLLLKLANFDEVCMLAAKNYDPSKIARYLFVLAQSFNSFYDKCPVLKADEQTKQFRLKIIKEVERIMQKGLYLLGVETVEKM